MDSYNLLPTLKEIPKAPGRNFNKDKLYILKNKDIFIQAGLFSTLIAYHALEDRNIPDGLFDAYNMSFTNSDSTLYSHYQEILSKGDNQSVVGFVNNLKGKFFEVYLQDGLTEYYPGFKFTIAENPTQPIWDIVGTSQDGEQIFVQAKMWNERRSEELSRLIGDNPDTIYATSREIREKVLNKYPELEDRFIPIEISEYKFTEDVKDALETLKENMGFDLPDGVFALAPYSTEIILGIQLLLDLAKVNRDFSKVQISDKSRIAAVKVLILFSRFGITTILTIAGGAAGSVVPGYGNVVGGIGGAMAARWINKKIAPYSLEIAYKLVGLTYEDMFYFKNIERISKIELSYINNKSILINS